MEAPQPLLLDLSQIFTWAMPAAGARPWRVAHADRLVQALASVGYLQTVTQRADDTDAELSRWRAECGRAVWVEYAGFDGTGLLAQLAVSLRDNRDQEQFHQRVQELADLLRGAAAPFGWRVTVTTRFNRPYQIVLAG